MGRHTDAARKAAGKPETKALMQMLVGLHPAERQKLFDQISDAYCLSCGNLADEDGDCTFDKCESFVMDETEEEEDEDPFLAILERIADPSEGDPPAHEMARAALKTAALLDDETDDEDDDGDDADPDEEDDDDDAADE